MKVEISYSKDNAVVRVKTVEMNPVPSVNDRMFCKDPDGVIRDVVVTHRYFDVSGKDPFMGIWVEEF